MIKAKPARAQAGQWTPTRFRLLVALSAIAVALGLAVSVASADASDWTVFLALGVLFCLAENRDQVFSDETGLSGSIAVALAGAFFAASSAWLMAAFVIAAVGGLYVPHVRRAAASKIAINAACFGFSALAAAGVANAVVNGSLAWQIVGLVAATVVYWAVNCFLLGIATATLGRNSVGSEVLAHIRSDTVMLAFGFGGAVCGLVMVEVGPWIGIATLVALLAVLDVFVISVPAGLASLRAAWQMVVTRGVAGTVSGTVGALLTRWVGISLLGAIAGFAIGVLAGLAVVAAVVGLRMVLRHDRLDVATLLGIVVVEAIVPLIAAVAGVVTAVAGLDIGLLVASGLVLGTTAAVAVRRHLAAKRPVIADDDDLMAAVVEALVEGLPVRDR